MYADYNYYQTEYGGKMPKDDYKLWERKAERKIDNLTGKKLRFAFPVNEGDAQAVKDCVCELAEFLYQIAACDAAAMDSMGIVAQADGTLRGKVITSISSGNESIGYSAAGFAGNAAMEASKDKKKAETMIYGMVKGNLRGVPDRNGINLLYAGAYPHSRKHASLLPDEETGGGQNGD